jgi:hypothetical protein
MSWLWTPLSWPVAFGGAAIIGALLALYRIVDLLRGANAELVAIQARLREMSSDVNNIANIVHDIQHGLRPDRDRFLDD